MTMAMERLLGVFIVLDKKIKTVINSYEEFISLFNHENCLIQFITKNYSNEELMQLKSYFDKAKQENIPGIFEFSDAEIKEITKLHLENPNVKKYDIVKFQGINNYIETGIVKKSNNIDHIYEIQTLDKKSLLYSGTYKILEKLNTDKSFSFSNKKFHTFKLGTKFQLNFTEEFLTDYTRFYHDNFGQGKNKQLEDFITNWKLHLNNIYDLELSNYNGRYSYFCILNNIQTFNTFIIHEDLIKNHVIK
jgi:hypothetical protein